MQDIHSIGGNGGGSLFGGGGDRRLRPSHHHTAAALKCPRCDSLNTKFCYYNNYNLSQPRHFCKSCRRYWTKGGVLRNVPVGGGCRKTKRNNKPKTITSDAVAPSNNKSNSHSSSESSSINVTSTVSTEAVSVPSSSTTMHEAKYVMAQTSGQDPSPNPGFVHGGSDYGLFGEMGSFTSLMGSSEEPMGFGFGTMVDQQQGHHQMVGSGGLIDQTVGVELPGLEGGGFGPSDWQSGGDQSLFDLTDTVDHAYWSTQTTGCGGGGQWSDDQVQVQDQHHSPSLYLP